MARREWPLVAFTLLGQLATGIYLFLVLPTVLSGPPFEKGEGPRPLPYVLGVVIVLLGIAAAASFFHLGRPLRAPNALANLRTSWLSREILFELLFLFSLAVLLLLIWQGRRGGMAAKGIALFAGVMGALFIISMVRLYMVPGVAAWNRLSTPFSFLLATMVLGILGGLVAARIASRAAGSAAWAGSIPSLSLERALVTAAAALVVLSVVGHVLLAPDHGVLAPRISSSLKPTVVFSSVYFAFRLALLAGCGLALFAVLGSNAGEKGSLQRSTPLIWIAFGLAAASELLARFEFYALGGGRR